MAKIFAGKYGGMRALEAVCGDRRYISRADIPREIVGACVDALFHHNQVCFTWNDNVYILYQVAGPYESGHAVHRLVVGEKKILLTWIVLTLALLTAGMVYGIATAIAGY
jgi:hypothetical protein